MYQNYFGFSTMPFSITPDPRFIYDTPSYREAFASLHYGIEARKGFIVITGEAGTGKTTLIKSFTQRADVKIRAVLINNPKLTVIELLASILSDLGVAPSAGDQGALTSRLNDCLVEQFQKRHIVVVLLDEAQHLSNEVLEHLRLLSNLEIHGNKLIQIVLAGQPELEEQLNQPVLRQLKQRVALCCRLAPLTKREVYPYIQARLEAAGFEGKGLFDQKAIERITLYSSGIPRLVNVICDNALVIGYALSRTRVSAEMIEEVACDLKLPAPVSSEKPRAPRHSETANAAREETRSGLLARPPTSLLQSQSAAFQDAIMVRGQRRTRTYRQRRLSGLGTGFVFGVLATAGIGLIFYPQLKRNDISDIAAQTANETRRESLKTTAVDSGALLESPSIDGKDPQSVAAEKPPLSTTQQSVDSGTTTSAAPIVEASKTASPEGTENRGGSQAARATKADAKDAETGESSVRRANESSLSRTSANDRLKLAIHKAIANRAITGVEVFVVGGTVVLHGRVATKNQKTAANQAARSVAGTKYIRDQILVNGEGADPRYSHVRSEHPHFGG